ncbi:MucBP domain-containing protein [Lactiplantibacillus dongliensis]|uniref:MucBP domain-containing protein n=1 Tax=Lactiplantibacillus dongliensis TaxID=2559919 RepID=A0ABW1RAV7_9LACO|nr:MucBP domain-containing protein [Lactiplantibacillus dongliensis]
MLTTQRTKEHVKMYKHKKLWMIMGITTAVMVMSTTQLTVASANTNQQAPTATQVSSAASSSTSQASTSAAPSATSSVTSESKVSGQSAASASASAGSSASSSVSQAPTSVTSGTSAASDVANSATSAGNSAASNASAGSVSSQGSQVKQAQSVASQARGRMARSMVSTGTTTTTTTTTDETNPDAKTPDPATVVTIPDANLRAIMKKVFNVADNDELTIGTIEKYRGSLSIETTSPYVNNNPNIADTTIESLAGIESLQYLAPSVGLTVRVAAADTTAGINIDLSPLAKLRMQRLELYLPYPAKTNLDPLKAIDGSAIYNFGLSPSIGQYQGHQYGMTNAQLASLGPWLTAIGNNGHSPYIGIDNNALSDFSPLAGITGNAFIAAEGQMIINRNNTLNLVNGQPVTFTGITLTGLKGETINDAFRWSFNTNGAGQQRITSLGNNQYQIDNVQQYPTVKTFLIYGNIGYVYSDYDYPTPHGDFVEVKYPDGTTLITDMQVYQSAHFQDHPNVTVKYVDQNVKPIAALPDRVVNGVNLGDTYDLSSYMNVPGYKVIARTAPLTGTYTLDPQYLYLMAVPDVPAGAVTVNYVDTDGQVLGTTAATYPRGQLVDLTYTTTQKAFDGYTFSQMGTDSLAANGTLTAAGGTVTYVYTKNPVLMGQVTVNYVDDTNATTLKTVTLTGEQGSAVTDDAATTIADYLAAGYELGQNDLPTTAFNYTDTAQTYTVHFKHQLTAMTTASDLQKAVTRTIHYVYANGKTAAADQVATVNFMRTGQVDLVTGVKTYTDWVAANGVTDFAAQVAPTIAGYTADHLTVAAMPVTAASADLETTVTYTANPVQPTKPTKPATNPNQEVTPPTKPATDHNTGVTTPAEPNTDQSGATIDPTSPDTGAADGITVTTDTNQPVTTTAPTVVDDGVGDTIAPTSTNVNTGQPVKLASAKTVDLAPDGDALNAGVSRTTAQVSQPTTKAVIKTTTVVPVKAAFKPVTSSKMATPALPQTSDDNQPATAWLGLGVLLTSLLTALGFKARKQD